MERLRLGIIGCGVIGNAHLKSAAESPEIETVAVADLREQVAKEVATKFNVRKVYSSGDALLEDPEIVAVVLAMPACVRTELALRAFAKGKHVLTEKPVAMNAAEVRRLMEARGKLTVACCSSRFRFTKNAEAATTFVASGGLGDLRVIRCRAVIGAAKAPTAPPPPWRLRKSQNGGGILMNWGCYDLDYLLGITGWKLRPKTASGQVWQVAKHLDARAAPASDAETHVCAIIRCEEGTVIMYERAEFAAAQTENSWQIVGTKGSLKLTMTGGEKKRTIIHDDTTSQDGVITKTLWEGVEDLPPMNTLVLRDFAAAIREGRQPKTGLEESLVVQKISDAIYASAEKGKAVEIQ